jgi:hypothetical protein
MEKHRTYTIGSADTLPEGISRNAGQRRLRVDPTFRRLARGTYGTRTDDIDEQWLQGLEAILLRSGSQAAVGLRSAARLHRLDGFLLANDLDCITSIGHHVRDAKVHRTRTLTPDDLCEVRGLPCTSLARTLYDLGRVCTVDKVELALESALRGPDLGKPNVWNSSLLDELNSRCKGAKARTGATQLRATLARRPIGARPTGSYAETCFWQGQYRIGYSEPERQCDIRLFDSRGRLIHHYYVDFLSRRRLMIDEVNGAGPRGGATMTAADVARMAILQRCFRVNITTGADAVHRPEYAARRSREIALAQQPVSFPFVRNGRRIEETATGLDVFVVGR